MIGFGIGAAWALGWRVDPTTNERLFYFGPLFLVFGPEDAA